MSANRHLGRIIALQTLYEQDFRVECGDRGFKLDAVLKRNIARYQKTVDDPQFVEKLVRGVSDRTAKLDELIQPIAPEWPLAQIARVDRVVLRMGTYELLFDPGTPAKVIINEAVELAKAFGGDNSSRFINGVLGTMMREHRPEAEATPAVKTTKKVKKAKK